MVSRAMLPRDPGERRPVVACVVTVAMYGFLQALAASLGVPVRSVLKRRARLFVSDAAGNFGADGTVEVYEIEPLLQEHPELFACEIEPDEVTE